MRFIITGTFLFIAFTTIATAEEWSWGKDKSKPEQTKPATDPAGATDREGKSIDSYAEANDDNVSGSQEDDGPVASLSGNGTDTHARHVIRDRLCGLGLMEVKITRNIITYK